MAQAAGTSRTLRRTRGRTVRVIHRDDRQSSRSRERVSEEGLDQQDGAAEQIESAGARVPCAECRAEVTAPRRGRWQAMRMGQQGRRRIPEVGFTEPSGVWDKFHIYQGHRRNTAFIGIGRRHRPRRLKVDKHPNALKQALHYRELLESGHADSQGELSRLCGTPRTTISAYLRLLGLDEELRAEALNLSDEDERVSTAADAQMAADILESVGWVCGVEKPTPGRTAFIYYMNPKILERVSG